MSSDNILGWFLEGLAVLSLERPLSRSEVLLRFIRVVRAALCRLADYAA